MPIKIIAELSANHNHDIDIAKQTIKAAKDSGADAIKLQTYTPDTMTLDCDKEHFQLNQGTIWDGTTLYELYKKAYTPWEWHRELFDYAKEVGIGIFSTPFDKTAVDFLEGLNTPVYKIASFEITDIPLIEYVAKTQKPIILSVGIATLEEIEDAVKACRFIWKKSGLNKNEQPIITLLQCTSQYPAKPEDANLSTMLDMKERFDVEVGLSDHTMGHEVVSIAVAMGASIIEKHFILDRNMGGVDSTFSMNPSELQELVRAIRRIETIKGQPNYKIDEAKEKSRVFARSLFVLKNVKQGDIITLENVGCIRPGYGLSPKYLNIVMGKQFTKDLERGTPLKWEQIKDRER